MASADAETLYGLPPDEFTAARDELAKAYRKERRKEDADRVAALRKPVLSAWVVNRLARDERKTMRGLVDAAAAIRSGGDGAERAFREALDRLTTSARSLLVAEGHAPDPTLQQVWATLRSGAASDPDALLAGTLAKPIEASGFAAMAGASVARPTSRASRPKTEPRVDRKAVEQARRAVELRSEREAFGDKLADESSRRGERSPLRATTQDGSSAPRAPWSARPARPARPRRPRGGAWRRPKRGSPTRAAALSGQAVRARPGTGRLPPQARRRATRAPRRRAR